MLAPVAVPELLLMGDPAGIITKDLPRDTSGDLAFLAFNLRPAERARYLDLHRISPAMKIINPITNARKPSTISR